MLTQGEKKPSRWWSLTDEQRQSWRENNKRWHKNHPKKAKARNRKYHQENRDRVRKQKAAWHKKNPSARGRYMRKAKYGLTEAEYQSAQAALDGKCAICRLPETSTYRGKVRALAVDHHHVSGRLRSLLCVRCNMLIGQSKESPELLREAAAYLEKWAIL